MEQPKLKKRKLMKQKETKPFTRKAKVALVKVLLDAEEKINQICMIEKKYYQLTLHIFTMDENFKMDDSINYSTVTRDLRYWNIHLCKSEQELLLRFTEKIQEIDPLVLTGYDVHMFDFKHMNIRARALGIHDEFCKLSKKNKTAKFVSESDNSQYYNTIGRKIFDLKKFIQKKYFVCSYEPDDVVMIFLNKKNTSFIQTCITCAQLLDTI